MSEREGEMEVGGSQPQITYLDEIGEMQQEGQSGVNPAEMKLDGESIPEEFRGKTLADLLGQVSGFKTALQTSEEARRQALATAEALSQGRREAPAAPPAPAEEPKEWSEEELKKLHDEDPFKYQQVRFEMMERRLARNVDARITPMAGATADAAERVARAQFPEEFQLLGKEINDFVSQAFPDKSVLAQPGAWDRVVKYVRGEHIDKIISHREQKKATENGRQRQDAESDAAPPSLGSNRAPSGRQGKLTPANMDSTQKEIARNLGISDEDYCKHYI